MSWIQKLHETYENCQSMIGASADDKAVPLLPICHTTQKAHIEIVLDQRGNFRKATVVVKDEARTIIPCTEKSGGRTSGETPHPLCDKLQYIAGDYAKYGGSKKPYSHSYVSELEKWCTSGLPHAKAGAVLRYVKKGTVIKDLVDHQLLVCEANGKLVAAWDKRKKGDVPKIFEVLSTQEDAFVRWQVVIPGDPESKVWKDKGLWENWIRYYTGTKKAQTLCYVTGVGSYTADQHPAKLRYDGDKAKLISSNDSSGFTFRGRFLTADEACGVGFETTQKAHSALRWLIGRQGYRRVNQAIVAWATSGAPLPQPTDDPVAVLGLDGLLSNESLAVSTAQGLALRLKKRIAGYGSKLGDTTDVVVMALDSASTGRMAIVYYRELTGSDFLQRIHRWHESCAWVHDYAYDKETKRYFTFVGAPAPVDIAEAAYGSAVDDKLRKATVERVLPCIVDGRQIPRDLVHSAVRRASNRVGMEDWEWNKTLSIACALYRNHARKENYDMALETDRKTRDYLYGRLLALADNLEQWALKEAGEGRQTSAVRLMNRFSEYPYSTWRTIELALGPYKARLGGKANKRQRVIDEVMALFERDDFISDKRLSGEFLLGYHCQRRHLKPNQGDDLNDNSEENSNES